MCLETFKKSKSCRSTFRHLQICNAHLSINPEVNRAVDCNKYKGKRVKLANGRCNCRRDGSTCIFEHRNGERIVTFEEKEDSDLNKRGMAKKHMDPREGYWNQKGEAGSGAFWRDLGVNQGAQKVVGQEATEYREFLRRVREFEELPKVKRMTPSSSKESYSNLDERANTSNSQKSRNGKSILLLTRSNTRADIDPDETENATRTTEAESTKAKEDLVTSNSDPHDNHPDEGEISSTIEEVSNLRSESLGSEYRNQSGESEDTSSDEEVTAANFMKRKRSLRTPSVEPLSNVGSPTESGESHNIDGLQKELEIITRDSTICTSRLRQKKKLRFENTAGMCLDESDSDEERDVYVPAVQDGSQEEEEEEEEEEMETTLNCDEREVSELSTVTTINRPMENPDAQEILSILTSTADNHTPANREPQHAYSPPSILRIFPDREAARTNYLGGLRPAALRQEAGYQCFPGQIEPGNVWQQRVEHEKARQLAFYFDLYGMPDEKRIQFQIERWENLKKLAFEHKAAGDTRDLNEITISLDTFYHSLYPKILDKPFPSHVLKAIGRVSFEFLRLTDFKEFNVDELNIPSIRRTIRSLTCGKRFVYERDETKCLAEWSVLEDYEMTKDLRGKPGKEILRWDDYCCQAARLITDGDRRWVSEIVLDLNTQFQIHSGSETHDEEQHSVGEGGGVEDVRGNEERDTEEGTAEEEETTRFEGVDAEVTVDDVADDEKDDDDMTDEGSTIHVAHPEESNMEAYMEENENEEEEEISGDRVGTHQAVTVTASIEEDEGAITEEGEAIHVANFEQLDTIEEVEENTAEHDEVTYLGESCGGPETEEDEEATPTVDVDHVEHELFHSETMKATVPEEATTQRISRHEEKSHTEEEIAQNGAAAQADGFNTEVNNEEAYEQSPLQNHRASHGEGSCAAEQIPADAEATHIEGVNVEAEGDAYEQFPFSIVEPLLPATIDPQRSMEPEDAEEVNTEASTRSVSVANTNISAEVDVQMTDPEEANSHASSPAFFEADEGNANVSMEATDIVTAPNVVISEDVAEVVEEAVVPKEAYTVNIIEIHEPAPKPREVNTQQTSMKAAGQRSIIQDKDNIVNIREWLL
ncbi:hypothetical protein GLAREA_05296 [Glarea lozoyensis ATCC 20868]|uniref:Uncharacterized protein n=1 Tax=Glarea lozoyensis (strain ATCC 20868 / MF5171) TaxID=1116229 RepID=S3ECB9_GLAL2|nr:uncharacterized protein GLAREA_05296 [Glarea lozoyensis ATCC 20868]EPE35958.1 hypothetical protein GLAREA_05296 [Glarea lozoyensis ATCC 20868]